MADAQNDMVITSDEQAAAMERAAAAYRAEKAAAEKAARDDKLAPLRAIVNGDGYAAVVDGLAAIVRAGTFADDASIDVHLRAVAQIMPNLKSAVA
ncbi:hypothetical protein EV283_0448 [Sphingomonas sp. BK036]|uniref:hypothetical protein n=1 Tax=Sphingomonas sp. BK036 TaxID=2512122 RepID=UPI001029A021|nr:hypothetical protein [Sphingomonas sp. BK036]RZT56398.1 hypothetical protein EV283_0448 [Sphingomonas sp. BK036]